MPEAVWLLAIVLAGLAPPSCRLDHDEFLAVANAAGVSYRVTVRLSPPPQPTMLGCAPRPFTTAWPLATLNGELTVGEIEYGPPIVAFARLRQRTG